MNSPQPTTPEGRGRGQSSENAQVRYTGDWSSNSKLSSIANGYWEDPFLSFFNKVNPVPRRTSLICRGYYVRFRVCDFFVRSILEIVEEPIQIVSLGCGMDTTFFRILPQFEGKVIRFFELDFDSVIQLKKSIISENEVLNVMQNGKLGLVSADLRRTETLREALVSAGFQFNAPTLFYSECVVNYLKPHESENILKWIVANVPKCIWLAYEQCNDSDSFGKIMVKHFETNGCPLLSLPSQPDMDSQLVQLQSVGFQAHYVLNAWDAFLYLTRNEDYPFPKLTGKSQQFDEYEALLATCLHYSVRVGMNGIDGTVAEFFRETNSGISSLLQQPLPSADLLPSDSNAVELYEIQRKLTGHTSLIKQNTVFVFGGCNESSQRCAKLEEVTLPVSQDQKVETKFIKEDRRLFERMYSSAVYHRPTDSFYIFGGRKSPQNPCDNDLVQISAKPPYVVKTLGFDDTAAPEARWRSSMVVAGSDLMLFGGKSDKEVLGDCWKFQFSTGYWTELKPDSLPSSRHSHSMCWDSEKNQLYCVGGLTKDETNLCSDSVWCYELDDGAGHGRWKELEDLRVYGRRIGHSCAVVNRNLCIVGGYGANSSYSLNHFTTLINMEDSNVRIFYMQPSVTFLPFGFSMISQEEDSSTVFLVYGGGGNCFSFGTHLNNHLLRIKIDSF